MINARVETVHEKPAFRRAFLKRRCLLPADGFYEGVPGKDPATGKARKQPYFIHAEDDQVSPPSPLRGVCLPGHGRELVRDFVAAWNKVMNLDRFDLR